MCIFAGSDVHVAGTKIFARRIGPQRQGLAYAMRYESAREVAMVLPLPTPSGAGEDAVRFLDLSGYPELFEHLEACFPVPRSKSLDLAVGAVTLTVHAVGSFEASFVPSRADFARLDARFQLPEELFVRLPEYDDYGFAVFRLKAGALKVHPMAFEFPTREPSQLFFPTVHVHYGTVQASAYFDHMLYAQVSAPQSLQDQSPLDAVVPVGELVQVERTQGLVNASMPLVRQQLLGVLPNRDTWLAA